jgi:endonuclease/exonuclease/phosphatase family metal-dependent hydrolase
MRIGPSTGPRPAARPTEATAPAPRPQAAAPRPLRVITFNTAVGNSKYDHMRQQDFLKLPMYQDVIQGRPDAPIMALQEVGPEQAAALKQAAKSGNFQVVDAWPRQKQGNALLIPKRFEVLSKESQAYSTGHWKGVWNAVKDWWKSKELPSAGMAAQLVEPRMYTEVRLRDRETGREFTVFNTHTSIQKELRLEQSKELAQKVDAAQKRGPVLLAGDLNTHTARDAVRHGPTRAIDAQIRDLFSDMLDLGPTERPGNKPNIDYVLGSGFTPVSSRYYTGEALQLEGHPNAESISDHYAEEDVVVFK